MKVAQQIWKEFPCKWEVRVIDHNQKAKEFWMRAITEFVGLTFEPLSTKTGNAGTSSHSNLDALNNNRFEEMTN